MMKKRDPSFSRGQRRLRDWHQELATTHHIGQLMLGCRLLREVTPAERVYAGILSMIGMVIMIGGYLFACGLLSSFGWALLGFLIGTVGLWFFAHQYTLFQVAPLRPGMLIDVCTEGLMRIHGKQVEAVIRWKQVKKVERNQITTSDNRTVISSYRLEGADGTTITSSREESRAFERLARAIEVCLSYHAGEPVAFGSAGITQQGITILDENGQPIAIPWLDITHIEQKLQPSSVDLSWMQGTPAQTAHRTVLVEEFDAHLFLALANQARPSG